MRNDVVSQIIGGFLHEGDKVLDVGAGNGCLGKKIEEVKSVEVTLLDIIDFNRTNLPLHLYDGKQIPFADNVFDVGMLIFVLHHCADPLLVLKETLRVSKDRVIIAEDTFDNRLEHFMICINDVVVNFPSLFVTGLRDRMNFPFHFKRVREWEEIFRKIGVKAQHVEQLRVFPIPLKKTLFVLKK